MFCDRILGNLDDEPPDAPVVWVDLTWRECVTRALRKQTRDGRKLRIVLALGQRIGHRDILYRAPDGVVAANLIECDVIVATPRSPPALASAAIELGNLHLPVEVDDSKLIVLPDGPALAIFEKYAIDFHTERRRFVPMKSSVVEMSVASKFSIVRGGRE